MPEEVQTTQATSWETSYLGLSIAFFAITFISFLLLTLGSNNYQMQIGAIILGILSFLLLVQGFVYFKRNKELKFLFTVTGNFLICYGSIIIATTISSNTSYSILGKSYSGSELLLSILWIIIPLILLTGYSWSKKKVDQ